MINISKFFRSFRYAFNGIYILIVKENNARIHTLAAIFVLGISFYYQLTSSEWLWVSIAIALVFTTEALNTAIEKLVDLVHPEFHSKAGEIKDLAAGAVLITAIFALCTFLIIFLPKFF